MEHTPGPWKVVDRVNVQSGPTGALAYVSTAGARGRTLDEAMANARLIAAAPDLLAACKLALETAGCVLEMEVGCAFEEAIAKATDEE